MFEQEGIIAIAVWMRRPGLQNEESASSAKKKKEDDDNIFDYLTRSQPEHSLSVAKAKHEILLRHS